MKYLLVMCMSVMVIWGSALCAEAKSKTFTSSVWAGVPAIGHCYVKQDYNINYTLAKGESGKKYRKISSAKTVNGSYMSGLSIGTWSGTSSKVTVPTKNSFVVIVESSGTITYGVKFLNYTTGIQTFKDTIKHWDVKD